MEVSFAGCKVCSLIFSVEKSLDSQTISEAFQHTHHTHTLNHSPNHSITHPITQSFTQSLTHLITHSTTHSFTHLLTNSLTHTYTQHSLIFLMLLFETTYVPQQGRTKTIKSSYEPEFNQEIIFWEFVSIISLISFRRLPRWSNLFSRPAFHPLLSCN